MAEYIDRNKIPAPYYAEEYDEYVVGIGEINSIPTADVQEVKHARYDVSGICSVCGSAKPAAYSLNSRLDYIADSEVKFCYFCGAKMDMESDENARENYIGED